MPRLLTGTVTFLFTDIEGSTALLGRLGQEQYEALLTEHDRIILDAAKEHSGRLVDKQGDALFLVFRRAREAVLATVEAQRQLGSHEWPDGAPVRVRMGLHTGEPHSGGRGYVGTGVHRASRIGDAAHGGQILVSTSTRQLLIDDPPPGVELRDVGVRKLRGLEEPEHLYQLLAPGLRRDFPPPRTAGAPSSRMRTRTAKLVALVALLILAGTVVALALRAGPSRATVRLLPNSLAAFDVRSGRPVADVPLGFTPVEVTVGADYIWVVDRLGQTVTAIDPHTLQVVKTSGLDGVPSGEWAGAGADWVAFSQTGSLDEVVIGGPTNQVPLWKPTPVAGSLACDLVVTGTNSKVWVSQGQRFAELDPRTGTVGRPFTLPAVADSFGTTCYGVRYTGGRLFALREPDDSIGTLDARTGVYTPILLGLNTFDPGLGGSYGSWVAGDSSLWLERLGTDATTLETRYELLRANSFTGNTIGQASIGQRSGSGSLGSVALATGALVLDARRGLWALAGGQALVHVEAGTLSMIDSVDLRHPPCCVAIGFGRIWVPLQSP